MNTRPRGPTVPATAKRTASVKNNEGRCTWKDDINRRWRAVNKGRGCKEHTMGRSKGVVKNKLKISDGDSSGVATTADPPTTSTKADTRSYTGINEKVLQDGLTWVSDQGAAQSGRDTNNDAPERDSIALKRRQVGRYNQERYSTPRCPKVGMLMDQSYRGRQNVAALGILLLQQGTTMRQNAWYLSTSPLLCIMTMSTRFFAQVHQRLAVP